MKNIGNKIIWALVSLLGAFAFSLIALPKRGVYQCDMVYHGSHMYLYGCLSILFRLDCNKGAAN